MCREGWRRHCGVRAGEGKLPAMQGTTGETHTSRMHQGGKERELAEGGAKEEGEGLF